MSSLHLLPAMALLGLTLTACNNKGGDDDGDGDIEGDGGGGGWDIGDGGSGSDGGVESDGGTSDGGTSDGGTSDGGTSDGGTSDGGVGDGGGDGGAVGDADHDGYTVEDGDCDDHDADIHPGAEEICDEVDNNCNDRVDEGVLETFYVDSDDDDFGVATSTVEGCVPPDGYAATAGDCDDDDRAINPDADEVCDGADNDCDDEIDEADAIDATMLALDEDGDGFGEPYSTDLRCHGSPNELDCDDSDASEPQVVDAAATGTPDGTTSAPWPTIQEGIDSAEQCVVVAAGIYTENVDFGGRGVSVVGIAGAPATIIDGDSAGPAVTFGSSEGADSELRGFTLTDGSGHIETASEAVTDDSGSVDHYIHYVTSCGGGLFIDGAEPTLSELILRDNLLTTPDDYTDADGDEWYFYSYGGGACFRDTTLELNQIDVIGNDAGDGGGFFIDATAQVALRKSVLTENTAEAGAGIQVDGGQLAMTNVLTSWNAATVEGGGIMVIDGAVNATNVTMGGDGAPTGGALYLATDSVGSEGTVMNAIIAQSTDGEGVMVDSSSSFDGSYNDVWGNDVSDYSGVIDPTGGDGNISENPDFVDVTDDGDWTNDDWTLDARSPAVDAGNSASAYDDADGTRNDMGAFGGPESDWLR